MKKVTWLSAAAYCFLIALATKGIVLLQSHHPPKEDLLSVEGMVREVRLGGQGSATWFRVESDGETRRYSSYYGVAWPGMEHIGEGDRVQILAERNRLNRNELFTGREYYIWELAHDGWVVVSYDGLKPLIEEKESTLNRYVDGILGASVIFLLLAYLRQRSLAD
jgi:hypothetical protein